MSLRDIASPKKKPRERYTRQLTAKQVRAMKKRGYDAERELVHMLRDVGYDAIRVPVSARPTAAGSARATPSATPVLATVLASRTAAPTARAWPSATPPPTASACARTTAVTVAPTARPAIPPRASACASRAATTTAPTGRSATRPTAAAASVRPTAEAVHRTSGATPTSAAACRSSDQSLWTVTVPVLPSTVTSWPVSSCTVASPVPTTAGMPCSRATIAECDRGLPPSVTSAPARPNA